MRRVALLLALACAGCPGLNQIAFDVNSTGRSQIPGSPAGGVLPQLGGFGALTNMSFNQSHDFTNNNTDKDHIDSARLARLTLKVVDPPDQTLSFLSSVQFHIKTDTLPDKVIATATSIPQGAQSIELTIPDEELADYARADSFSITTNASGTSPTRNTTLEADLTMHIVAHVL